ncbi:hypothetical protein QAD02_018369 [Eretmocerus hayati]|uniref:Uncharacterized protein n=1 Tax=Eretmocerus hayati TaxID=131215 RepID=A0ACC2PGI1_9HYME|nr:hypothetical protein QAD02_018369 [Eretmocerus hayati]
MASLRTIAVCLSRSCSRPTCRLKILQNDRSYSQFPKYFIDPVRREDQEALEKSGELAALTHLPTKPAFANETSSEFHDPLEQKFLNYIMRKGKKELARKLLATTFEKVKMAQIERYNKAPSEERDNIELNPRTILHNAIENCRPSLELKKVKKGSQVYQVPIPVAETRSKFLAMNWLIKACNGRDKKVCFPDRLSSELIDASLNQGRVVSRKMELYSQCEANRAYAHFRWL